MLRYRAPLPSLRLFLPAFLLSFGLTGCSCGGGVAPGIFDTLPGNGARDVWSRSDVLIEFAEEMDPGSVKVTFSPTTGAFGQTWDGSSFNLVTGFGTTMAPSTHYTVTVTGQSVSGKAVSHQFSFGTRAEVGDTTSPTFTSTPVDGADAGSGDHLVIQFSEPMRPSTVEVHHDTGTIGPKIWNDTFDRVDVAPPPGGWLAGSVNEFQVMGSDPAYNGTGYRRVTFKVPEPVPPLEVLGMSPPPGSANVPQYAWISLSFSRDMEPVATAAAVTISPSNSCYAGQSEWINPRMYHCRPSNTLATGTTYTVAVGSGARDSAGNALPAAYSATFTAASVTDTTAPAIVSTTPADGETGVLEGTPLVIHYSESMDRGTAEERFRTLANPMVGRFVWNADSTQLTYRPIQPSYPGLVVQWTDDFAEDYSGNYIYEMTNPRELTLLGVATTQKIPLAKQSVTVGTLGSRTDSISLLMIGDDARDQAREAFLTFPIDPLTSSPGYVATGVREAYLMLPQIACEGNVAALDPLLVEGIDPGAEFDAADLTSAAVGPVSTVTNPCSPGRELWVPVTEKVQADFAARATNGGRTHFRLRFTNGTNGDHRPDRIAVTSQVMIFTAPELHVVFEYVPAP